MHISRAVAWLIIEYGAAVVIRLGGNLVLTRILAKELFGLMALVNLLLQGVEMLSDLGIHANILRHGKADDANFLDTAWTLHVARGLVIALIAVVMAAPFAGFYGETAENQAALRAIIPVAAVTTLIDACMATKVMTELRRLEVGRVVLMRTIAQLLGTLVMILLAWRMGSVWALVWGTITINAVRTLLSFVLIPGRGNRLCWHRESARGLFAFGRWVALSTAITFFSGQADRLVLGKLASLEVLAVYSFAVMLATMSLNLGLHFIDRLYWPFVAQLTRQGQSRRHEVARIRRDLMWTIAPGHGAFMIIAPTLVDLMWTSGWHEAGPITTVLLAGVWFRLLWASYQAVLMAAGLPKHNALAWAVRVILFAAAVVPAYHAWGLLGLAAAVGISEVGVLVVTLQSARSHGYAMPLQDLVSTALLIGCCSVLFVVQQALRGLGSPAAVQAILVLILGAAGSFAALRAFWLRRQPPE